jgi:predicted deacylase
LIGRVRIPFLPVIALADCRAFSTLSKSKKAGRLIYSEHAGHANYTGVLGKIVRKGEELVQTLQFGRTARWVATLAEEDSTPILHNRSAVAHDGSELMKVFAEFREV